ADLIMLTLSGVSRHPVAELVDEDLHHYPHYLLKQVPRIGDHLRGHLADAQIVKMRLDRQPSEQVLRQRQLDVSLLAPVLHPQRKLRAMLRHRELVARLLWRAGASPPPAAEANSAAPAGDMVLALPLPPRRRPPP